MKIILIVVLCFITISCNNREEILVDEFFINTIDSVIIEEENIEEDTIVPLTIEDLKSLKIPYLNVIIKNSNRYSLYPELVAGIIKQESRFKHYVISNKNAIGLMQVVPDRAGQTINKIIYKKDEPIEDSLLLDPSFNIRIGCAYLYYLRRHYFLNVRNEISRRYCLISAYNTGVGNVVRALVNKSDVENIEGYNNLKKYEKFKIKMDIAINKINSMSHQKLKEYLMNNLPYAETIDYLDKVVSYIDEWKYNVEQVAMN